jgi:peptidoglycan/xylan/chitin deacetylase (PgdA/CDA1 family)
LEKYKTKYGIEGITNTRTIARGLALHGLSALYRWTGRTAALSRNRVQGVYLHHLFPEEEAGFRKLLRALSRDHRLISYSEAVDRIKRGPIDRPYIFFSFDDGLRQNLRIGQILNEFGVSGCFFICPSLVGETDGAKLKDICENRFGMPAMDLLNWDDVEQLLKDGHEIGSHTLNHRVLSRISEGQVQEEVAGSYEVLTRRLGNVKHFAWPEGRFIHFSPTAARIVYEAGFDSCASAERGCHIEPPTSPIFCVRRDYISAQWPLGHGFYFLARNSLAAEHDERGSNGWPENWIKLLHQGVGQ